MKDFCQAGLAVPAVPARCKYVSRPRIEYNSIYADRDGDRSNNSAVVRVHDHQHTWDGGAVAAASDVQPAIGFVHCQANWRYARSLILGLSFPNLSTISHRRVRRKTY